MSVNILFLPLLQSIDKIDFQNFQISGTDSTSETTSQIVNALTETLWFQVEEQLRLQLSDSVTQYLNDQLLVHRVFEILEAIIITQLTFVNRITNQRLHFLIETKKNLGCERFKHSITTL